MGKQRIAAIAGALVAGGLYWQLVCQATGVAEPWDSGAYWRFWYPIALLLSTTVGYLLEKDGWLASAMLIVAQLPVMLMSSGTGPLFMFGLLFTLVLAIPAIVLSLAAGLLALRVRSV